MKTGTRKAEKKDGGTEAPVYPYDGVHDRLGKAVKDFIRGYPLRESARLNRVYLEDLEMRVRYALFRIIDAANGRVESVLTGPPYKGEGER